MCEVLRWRFGLVGNLVGRINEVNQRLARLILWCVTDCKMGKPSWYVTNHPGQLSLAIHLWVGAMSTSESWDVNRHTAWCTSPVYVVWQCKLVSGWGLRKRRSAPYYVPYGPGRTSRLLLRTWDVALSHCCDAVHWLTWGHSAWESSAITIPKMAYHWEIEGKWVSYKKNVCMCVCGYVSDSKMLLVMKLKVVVRSKCSDEWRDSCWVNLSHCHSFGHAWVHRRVINPLYHCRQSASDRQCECGHGISWWCYSAGRAGV